MPQVHFVLTTEKAGSTAFRKIWSATDDASALIAAHQVIEAILHRYIQLNVQQPQDLTSAGLRFYQVLSLARCFRKNIKEEKWFWETLEYLNQIRNRLSHDIEVDDFTLKVHKLFEIAGGHIVIHAPNTDPIEREENKLKYFLMILCGVMRTLQDETCKSNISWE